jgi:hypothetical protein
MLTMTLLSISALLKTVFAGLAVRVVASIGQAHTRPAVSWVWLAAAFLVSAISGLAQAVWAALAFEKGAGSSVMDLYVRWMPAMNYSRFGVMVGLGIGLSVVAFLSPRPAFSRLFWPVVISAVLLFPGFIAGYLEGPYVRGFHQSRLSILQLVETLALLAALFFAVIRRSMDTWLWLALFVYGFRQVVNTLTWAGTVWLSTPGAWHPPVWLDPAIGIAVWLTMIGIATHRLRLARRGTTASSIFAIPGDDAQEQLTSATGIDHSRR